MDGRSCGVRSLGSTPRIVNKKQAHPMHMQIQHCEDGIRVTLSSIAFYGRPNKRLREYEVGQIVQWEYLGIGTEKLSEETLCCEVVNIGVGVEELEVDIDETLLALQVRAGEGRR